MALANFYNVSRLFDPADFPLGSPPTYVSLGNQGAEDVLASVIQLQDAKLGLFDAPDGTAQSSGDD